MRLRDILHSLADVTGRHELHEDIDKLPETETVPDAVTLVEDSAKEETDNAAE